MAGLLAELAQLLLEGGHFSQERAERGDRIGARLGHGAVGHVAPGPDARPHHPALLEAELVLFGLADDGGVELAAGGRLDEVADADHAVLLVDEGAHDQLAGRRDVRALEGGQRHHGRGEPALHVRGAAPVDPSVAQLAPEGWPRPLSGIAFRHDIRVAFQEEAAAAGALLADPGEDIWAAGGDLLHLDGQSLATEPSLDERRDLGLVRPRLAGTIDAGDADERARELDHLIRADLTEDAVEGAHRAGATPGGTTG